MKDDENLMLDYYSRILKIIKEIIDDKELNAEQKIRMLGVIL